jgi:beta-glucosidase
MKKRIVSILILSIFFISGFISAQNKLNPVIEKRIDSILKKLSLEQKIGQLNQLSGGFDKNKGSSVTDEQKKLIREGKLGSMLNVYGAKLTRELQEIAIKESPSHIPLIFGFDVIHGFRTAFPVPLAESCSWDPEYIEKSERVSAKEASAQGLHWTFAPMLDIARDPRWGRIMEGAGEDPFLGSAIAMAKVKGFQGEDVSSPYSISACAKHYVAYGAAEGGRDYNTVDISERTLREIYLPPFYATIKAGIRTFMSSFNEISGIPGSANKHTLTDILRDEWKFNGFVVSDWSSLAEVIVHGYAADGKEAAKKCLTAGVDMDMEGKIYIDHLDYLVKNKILDEKIIDEAVRRILRVKFELGLFDNPFLRCDEEREKKELLSKENLDISYEMAKRSIVLLKNKKEVLPLNNKFKNIAVIGSLADSKKDIIGEWSAIGRPEESITILEGIKSKFNFANIIFEKGCGINDSLQPDFSKAIDAAKKSDLVIMCLGESANMSSEANCRSSLDLPGYQNELFNTIYKLGKPVVIIIMNGRPLSITNLDAKADAIVEAWFPGTMGGKAVADIIYGDYNPSGKLTVSFPRTVGQIPIYYNHKSSGRPDISKYLDIPNTPLYPFGYGLSYAKFEYKNLKLDHNEINPNENIKVTVDITNTGKYEGTETAQLYIQDVSGSVTRPIKELKGFKKATIKPGETVTIEFTLTPELMGALNEGMKFAVEPGLFKVYAGTSSSNVLETKFEVK